MTIEEAIKHYEDSETNNKMLAGICVSPLAKNHNLENAEKCRQMIEWLRELQERRKADSCEGCKHVGRWENEYEYGVSCPCLRCARRAQDNYEPERRTDGKTT